MNIVLSRKHLSLTILALTLFAVFSLVGCSGTSKTTDEDGFGTIIGFMPEAANGTLVASNEGGRYVVHVDDSGRFSANLPVGTYDLAMRASTGEKLELVNRTVVVANNVAISVVNAEMVPIPVVKSVTVTQAGSTSVIVQWETDIESDGCVEYGPNELYGSMTFVTSDLSIVHQAQITGLTPNTTYHFRVVATRHNIEASKFLSEDYTFCTTSF